MCETETEVIPSGSSSAPSTRGKASTPSKMASARAASERRPLIPAVQRPPTPIRYPTAVTATSAAIQIRAPASGLSTRVPEGEGNAAAMVAEQPVQIWLTKGWKRATSMAAAARMAASPAPRAIHGFPRGARNGAACD